MSAKATKSKKSTKNVRITLTKKDLEQGIRNECYNCPIALAIKRKLNARTVYVNIEGFSAYIQDNNDLVYGDVSKNIDEFIEKFDAGKITKKKYINKSFYIKLWV